MAKSGTYEPTEASRGSLLDKFLEARVCSTLEEQGADSPIGSGLDVAVSHGHVIVSGVVQWDNKLHQTIEEIQQIEGVMSVTDDTVNATTGYFP
jgi:osmotically-inducible protein OsmY